MFEVSKAVDEFTEELKKTIYSESKEINPVILAIKNKKKYFEEKDFLWDTETMFRLWKKIYLNLMKKDGFEKHVNEYYKKDRKKHERKSAEDISKRLNVGHQFGNSLSRLQKKQLQQQQFDNIYTKQMYQLEKELAGAVKREIQYWQHNKQTHSVEDVLGGIESVLRGRSIRSDVVMRDIVDMISSSLGVFFHYNDYGYSMTNDPNTQKNVYLSLMQTCKACNDTGENIFDIMKSKIGFIKVYKVDKYHPDTYYKGGSLELNAELFNGKELSINLTPESVTGLFENVSNDDFYGNQLHYEFARRMCKNSYLLEELNFQNEYNLARLKKNGII